MGLFNRPTDKEILETRNRIFVEYGIPSLIQNGFVKSPFSTDWFGRDNYKDFSYTLCRLNKKKQLEILTTYIIRREKWIQIRLNVFKLEPELNSIEQLNELEGIKFGIPPNSNSEMRLRADDYKGIPLIYMLFYPEHKIGSYYSRSGFKRRKKKLTELIQRDMRNIDSFVIRWHEIHKPNKVNWIGEIIKE